MRLLLSLIMFLVQFSLFAQGYCFRGKVMDSSGETVPFANVALYPAQDSARIISGYTTDLNGIFTIDQLTAGKYILKVSYIGYATVSSPFELTTSEKNPIYQEFILEPSFISLQEVVVKGNNVTQGIDKSTYTFTDKQINKANESRELLSTLPNMHIDKSSNALSTINGKKVLILINGIQATDADLQLIAADKIRRVEYYDVPPIRYMDNAEIVLNVATKPLDTGYSGSLYGTVGEFFSNGNAAFSFVKGNNKFVVSYGTHINIKRSVRDIEQGIYLYQIGNDVYNYKYKTLSKEWGNQNNARISYSKSIEDDFDFQINVTGNIVKSDLRADKEIVVSQNQNIDACSGLLSDYTKSKSPAMDIYYSKKFKHNNTLIFDILGTMYDNRQHTVSSQTGEFGFDDNLLLNNKKSSIIGELVYEHALLGANITAGYRGYCNFLSNNIQNSLSEERAKNDIVTQKHRLYGEVSGRVGSFMYRASLGGDYDRNNAASGFDNLTFTPQFLLGYNINKKNSIRLTYESSTLLPNIQQLSDANILIMDKFYRSGNKDLNNAHVQQFSLRHAYTLNIFSLQTKLFYDMNQNGFFDNYISNGDNIILQTANAQKDHQRGAEISLNISPWQFLRIGGNVKFMNYDFQPTKDVSAQTYWSYPATVYLNASYKNFSLYYLQKFGGSYLNGLYKCGLEKASYLSLGYQIKKVTIEAKCFFPFIKNEFTNETTDQSLIFNKADFYKKRKDRTFALSFSWNFQSGKRKSSIEKSIENSDDDKGFFNVR